MRLALPVALGACLLAPATIADPPVFPDLFGHGSMCHPRLGEGFGPADRFGIPHLGYGPEATKPTRLPGFGTGGFKITTRSAEAQAWFNYGVQLAHAFYHRPAVEAFQQAELADPKCAMCAWGEAWAMGPTINFSIEPNDVQAARLLALKASQLSGGATPREKALIQALLKRYVHDEGGAEDAKAYADAMMPIAAEYSADNEMIILAADASMIYAGQANSDRPALERAKALLEPVLERSPNDTGAIHFYIHVTEWLSEASLALPYAKRLGALAPAAGHLVHMPSHTYMRVGLFEEGAQANVAAVAADEAYASGRHLGSPFIDIDYHLHNVHFGVIAAIGAGDAPAALPLADRLLALNVPSPSPWLQIASSAAYFAYGRLGEAGAAMALPEPGADAPVETAMWHYMRGEVRARAHDAPGVAAEAAAIKALTDAPPPAIAGFTWALGFINMARFVLEGRAAMIEERFADAATAFRQAADLEDQTVVADGHDPPVFWYPVRRSLALALYRAGNNADAQAEARRVLTGVLKGGDDGWPGDPLTLLLLSRIETASDPDAAKKDEAQGRAGWKGDIVALDWLLL